MKNTKKYIYIFIAYILLIVVLYAVDANRYAQKTYYEQKEMTTNFGAVTKDMNIIEQFQSKEDISSIDLIFGTYNKKNTNNVIVQVKEDLNSNETLFSKTFNMKNVKDNVPYRIDTNLENIKDKKLYLVITTDTIDEGNTITLWYGKKKSKESKLFINSDEIDGELKFSLNKKEKKGIRW